MTADQHATGSSTSNSISSSASRAAGRAAGRAVETVWRMESAQLVAGLARVVQDVGTAEELAQDALVSALEQWPQSGIPDRPGAWLMAVGKRRAIDLIRRQQTLQRKVQQLGHQLGQELGHDLDDGQPAELDAVLDDLDADAIPDDLLRLLFVSCHPVLPADGRVALTLRLLGGLTTAEIASAFLVPESTVAQRIVRAKKTLSAKQVPFEVPSAAERPARLASVLEVIYLIFNEGYAATAGDDVLRPQLGQDATRLGRMLAQLTPGESEVHGLVALMEIQASRTRARVAADGSPVLLLDQDRSRWDQLLIRRGLAALDRARELAGDDPGPYLLQAELAACHARARAADQTDWSRITGLYATLNEVTPSPVVELNRAVAVSMADGPQAGLDALDALGEPPALAGYHLLPAVRGDLLARLERRDEARNEFERAAALTRNTREQAVLLARARSMGATTQSR